MAESRITSIYSAQIRVYDPTEIQDTKQNKCPGCNLREICTQMSDAGKATVTSPMNVEATLKQAACSPTQMN